MKCAFEEALSHFRSDTGKTPFELPQKHVYGPAHPRQKTQNILKSSFGKPGIPIPIDLNMFPIEKGERREGGGRCHGVALANVFVRPGHRVCGATVGLFLVLDRGHELAEVDPLEGIPHTRRAPVRDLFQRFQGDYDVMHVGN
jgi:hypothetical protein